MQGGAKRFRGGFVIRPAEKRPLESKAWVLENFFGMRRLLQARGGGGKRPLLLPRCCRGGRGPSKEPCFAL